MATDQTVTTAAPHRRITTEDFYYTDTIAEGSLVPVHQSITIEDLDPVTHAVLSTSVTEAAHTTDTADGRLETEAEARERARHEKREGKVRAALAGEYATAVYRRHILRTRCLTSTEKCFLAALLERGRRLTNIFPSPEYVSRYLSITTQRFYQLRASCIEKGFLRLWSLTIGRADDAGVQEFVSGEGYQVLLPARRITPQAAAWAGPEDWSNWCAKW